MSQDYTVAKELASLKEIKQSAEQRISDLSLNALNYVNDHRLHKADGGGTGGGALITNLTYDEGENTLTADKTWKELHDAALAGSPILAYDHDGDTLRIYNCLSFSTENSEYSVAFSVEGAESIFKTLTETGYPVFHIL